MTKLISFFCDDIPQLGRIGLQRCDGPTGSLSDHMISSADGKEAKRIGWTVSLRGAALLLVSPPGWTRTVPASQWDAKGPRRVFEVPRSKVHLEWETDDVGDLEKKIQRYDSEPMTRKLAEVPVAGNAKEVGDA